MHCLAISYTPFVVTLADPSITALMTKCTGQRAKLPEVGRAVAFT